MVLAFYRMAMATVLLAPLAYFKNRQEFQELKRKDALLCIVSGAFLGLHFAAYFESLRWAPIASAVVLVDTEVLFVALGTVLILRRKLPKQAWLAVALAFGGSVIVAMVDTTAGQGIKMSNVNGRCRNEDLDAVKC